MWLFWLICAGFTAWLANRKGRNALLWFIFGLFAPILTLIIVVVLPAASGKPLSSGSSSGWENLSANKADSMDASEDYIDVSFREVATITCPECGKPAPKTSNYCGNCGKKLKSRINLDKRSDPLSNATSRCGKCGELMPRNFAFCPNCGNRTSH